MDSSVVGRRKWDSKGARQLRGIGSPHAFTVKLPGDPGHPLNPPLLPSFIPNCSLGFSKANSGQE